VQPAPAARVPAPEESRMLSGAPQHAAFNDGRLRQPQSDAHLATKGAERILLVPDGQPAPG